MVLLYYSLTWSGGPGALQFDLIKKNYVTAASGAMKYSAYGLDGEGGICT